MPQLRPNHGLLAWGGLQPAFGPGPAPECVTGEDWGLLESTAQGGETKSFICIRLWISHLSHSREEIVGV